MAASAKIPREMDKDKSAKDILLTRQELMDYLKIKQGTLRKLMLNNEFPYFKLERRVLFRKEDIDKWLETKRVRKTAKGS